MTKILPFSPQMRYEGASRGRRFQGWATQPTGPNEEIRQTTTLLRDRVRDLVRNNPYARRAVEVLETNTISTGIIYQAANKRLDKLAIEFFDYETIDADGQNDFYGLQSLVFRAVVESGEVLVRRRPRRLEDNLPVPLQLQVMEADYLDTSKTGDLKGGGKIVQGIQFSAWGKREGYWIYRNHPGDGYNWTTQGSYFVPASEILHVYRQERPGQIRGVPWCSSAIARLRDFDDYQDAHRVRQKIAACFAAFRKKTGGPSLDDSEVAPPEYVEPGMIAELPYDEDIVFSSPPGVEGYSEYSRVELHAIAIGFGIPYFALTGDLSQVNYSSGRLGWLDFQRNIKKNQEQIMIRQFCQPVWDWFVDAARLQGFPVRDPSVQWTPPKRELIDPAKEGLAMRNQIRAGLISHSEALRQLGYDPATVFEELAEDRKRLAELGIVNDSDPGYNLNLDYQRDPSEEELEDADRRQEQDEKE